MAPRSQPSQSDEIVVRISGQLTALQQTLNEASTLVKNATNGWDASFTGFAAKNEATMKRVRKDITAAADDAVVSGQKWQKLATTATIAMSSLAVGAKPNLNSVLGAITSISFAFGALPGAAALAATGVIRVLVDMATNAKKVVESLGDALGPKLMIQIAGLEATLRQADERLEQIASLSRAGGPAVALALEQERKRLVQMVADLELQLAALYVRKKAEEDSTTPRGLPPVEVRDSNRVKIGDDFRDWQRKLVAGFGKTGVEMVKEVIQQVNTVGTATKKVQDEIAQGWMQAFAPMGRAIDQFVQQGGNLRDFWRMLWYDIVQSAVRAMYQMVATHAATELAKNNITFSSVVKRVAIEAWAAIRIIAMYAAQAAAAAWAALAGIPFIGPFLAVGAAIATFAGVMSLAKGLGSGSGPSGGPTRSGGSSSNPGTGGSNSGGPNTAGGGKTASIIVINAMDGQDVYRVLTRHPGAVGRAMRQIQRDGAMAVG